MTDELEQKWRAEFEALYAEYPLSRTEHSGYECLMTEHGWTGYLAACRARHAELEAAVAAEREACQFGNPRFVKVTPSRTDYLNAIRARDTGEG